MSEPAEANISARDVLEPCHSLQRQVHPPSDADAPVTATPRVVDQAADELAATVKRFAEKARKQLAGPQAGRSRARLRRRGGTAGWRAASRQPAPHPDTVRHYTNAVHPILLACSTPTATTPREVTRDDVKAALDTLHGEPQTTALVALRSLFTFLKKHDADR